MILTKTSILHRVILSSYHSLIIALLMGANAFPSSCVEDAKKLQESSDFVDSMKIERLGINAERIREEEETMGNQVILEELEPLEHEEEENSKCIADFGLQVDRFGDTVFYFEKLDKYFVELNWFPAGSICKNESQNHEEDTHDEQTHAEMQEAESKIFGSKEGSKSLFFTGMMDLSSSEMYALELNDERVYRPWPTGDEGSLAQEDRDKCPQAKVVPENKNCTLHNGKVLCGVFQVCGG